MKNWICFCGFILCLWKSVLSQSLPYNIVFSDTQIRLGKPIKCSLSIRYEPGAQIIFPDTNSFAPFEVIRKQYYPTEMHGPLAVDSVSYTLVSFSVDSLQHLKLHYKLVQNFDTIVHELPLQNLYFQGLIPTKSLPKAEYKFKPEIMAIQSPFPVMRLFILLLITMSFLALVYIFFTPTIKLWRKRYLLKKEYQRLLEAVNYHFQGNRFPTSLPVINQLWKAYLSSTPQTPVLLAMSLKEFNEWLAHQTYISNKEIFAKFCEWEYMMLFAGESPNFSPFEHYQEDLLKALEEIQNYKIQIIKEK